MYENRSLIPDWDTLRLVLSIHRYGGVSGAARFLGVTHATVSRRLSRAEEDANTIFFERLPAGLRLTDAGQAVLTHAHEMETNLNGLERTLLQHEQGLSGPLRITLPPLLMIDEISEDISQFAAEYPEIQLEFVGDNQTLNLHQREADVAIRVTRKPPETLWGRKITDQHASFYAQTDWLQKGGLTNGDTKSDIPIISFTHWKSPIPAIVRQLCPNARVVARCDDMVTAVQLVKAGLGITRMPKFLGESTEGITRVEFFPWESYFPVWSLTHPDLRETPRVKAFMQYITKQIVKRRDRFCVLDNNSSD